MPSPLEHLAQHAVQYEDTQIKGRLNNDGQSRGGDTEGTISSYQRPDKITRHDVDPMSAPPPPPVFQHIQPSPQQRQSHLSTTHHVSNDA